MLKMDAITALNWFPWCEKHFYVIWKLSYGPLPCSGGHFGFRPLAANAQGEIQGASSMLLRCVLIHRNGVFMFIVSQAVM